jgi:hypothetical protein
MKKYLYIAILLVLCVNVQAKDTIKQSIPFMNMLKAAESSDIKKFKSAYSKRIREDKEQSDWKKNVSEAKKNIKKIFGDIKDDNFTFKFDKDKSKLEVLFKGKSACLIDVIQEDGKWKLNER